MAVKVTVTIDEDGMQSMIAKGGILYRHVDRVGSTVSTVAKLNVGVRTGRLRQSINHKMIVRKTQVTARIQARPKYARIHHEGRGPVRAKNKKALKFRPVPRGKFVYRTRVGPAKGNPFLTSAVKTVTGKTPRRRDAGEVTGG